MPTLTILSVEQGHDGIPLARTLLLTISRTLKRVWTDVFKARDRTITPLWNQCAHWGVC